MTTTERATYRSDDEVQGWDGSDREADAPGPGDGPGAGGGDDRSTSLATSLGWGVLVSLCLGVLLFVGGLLTAGQDESTRTSAGRDPVPAPTLDRSSAATATVSPTATPTSTTTPTASNPPAPGAERPAGVVLYGFESGKQKWDVRPDDPALGRVRHERALPLVGKGSLAVHSRTTDGQWVTVALQPGADLSHVRSIGYTLASTGATPMLGLSGSWGWCQVNAGAVPSGRVQVVFDLRDGTSPAGLECTPERLSQVATINLWAPTGHSVVDDVRLRR